MATEAMRDALIKQVELQMSENLTYRKLLDGSADLPETARTEEFKRLIGLSRVDLGASVVEFVSERLNVDGFRTDYTQLDGDEAIGKAWSMAGGPLESALAIEESLSVGNGFLLMGVDPEGQPNLAAESADQMTVVYQRGSRRMIDVALKTWTELEPDGKWYTYARCYEADAITKWVKDGDNPSIGAWKSDGVEDNPLGFVPVVHLRNRPRLHALGGRSELFGLENDLDRVNKFMADLMLLSEFSGFRVRYATGINVDVDADGNPIQPFIVGPDRLLISPSPDAKFGDLSEAALDPSINAVKMAVTQVAALSRTPMFYLSGDMVNLSGDTLREMREQGTRKVKRRQKELASSITDAARMLIGVTDGVEEPDQLEVIWEAVETVDRFSAAQAAVQLVDANIVPVPQAQTDLGYSSVEKQRMESELRAQRNRQMAEQRLAAQAAPQPTTEVPASAPAGQTQQEG